MSDLVKHLDQIKRQVYNNSPGPCGLIDDIYGAAMRLDQYTDNNPHIEPITPKIVEVLWTAHGSPEGGANWPAGAAVEPPAAEELPAEEGETRRKRKG